LQVAISTTPKRGINRPLTPPSSPEEEVVEIRKPKIADEEIRRKRLRPSRVEAAGWLPVIPPPSPPRVVHQVSSADLGLHILVNPKNWANMWM
jgi:hypothetical protein